MRVIERVSTLPHHVAVGDQARPDGGLRLIRRIALATATSDAACILGSLALSYQIRFGLAHLTTQYAAVMTVAPPAWLGVFALFRLYEAHRLTPEEEFRRSVSAASVGMGLLVMLSYVLAADFSRIWLGLTCVLVAVMEMATRWTWRRLRRGAIDGGRIALRTLIVGGGEEASRLTQTLACPGLGFVVVAVVEPSGTSAHQISETLEALRWVAREERAQCVFVASSGVGVETVCEVARYARQTRLELLIASRLPEVLSTRLTVQRVGRTMAISVLPPRLTRSQAIVKRAFDLALASVLLIVTIPVSAVIAAAVKLSSSGPVLFRQPRTTTAGRQFEMLKFRTMLHGAGAVTGGSVAFFKLADDPRVTRVGRLLRRWSLDELPQLVNVLRGEMSLVGPRPLPVDQVQANPDLLTARLEVPAGMTGWWQIRGRSALAAEDAVRLDLFYIENWSLAYDLYVLLRTFGAVLGRRGAV